MKWYNQRTITTLTLKLENKIKILLGSYLQLEFFWSHKNFFHEFSLKIYVISSNIPEHSLSLFKYRKIISGILLLNDFRKIKIAYRFIKIRIVNLFENFENSVVYQLQQNSKLYKSILRKFLMVNIFEKGNISRHGNFWLVYVKYDWLYY